MRAADRNDRDAFRAEVPAAAGGQRFNRDLVADALDQDDGAGTGRPRQPSQLPGSRPPGRSHNRQGARCAGQSSSGHCYVDCFGSFCQTETWLMLSLVKGSRFQAAQRSRRDIPAICAIRSSSDGQA